MLQFTQLLTFDVVCVEPYYRKRGYPTTVIDEK